MGDEASGYKQPPKAHRFKRGQSGNPKGRPKGARNLSTDLNEMMTKRISVRENGKKRRITRQKALLLSLFEKGIHGDVRAVASIMSMMRQQPTWTEQSDMEFISESDRQIIEDFLRRNTEPPTHPHETATEPNDDELSST